MKPIKLTMQAFGPFASKEVVDFQAFGTHPIFLINGPTGAGKTSILDALCFALYGETTSNERLGSHMRSDQAAINVPTFVELQFMLGKKRYLVTRSPEQEAPKSRGEGLTLKKHTASLYEVTDGETLITSRTASVKTEITQLLGLNETQFRQVMVLPQGKFRELLLASSKDRELIFGQLFQTDIYKKIENSLKDKAGAICKEKEEFDNQILGALKVAEVESESELHYQLESIEQDLQESAQKERQYQEQLVKQREKLQFSEAICQQFSKLEQATNQLSEFEKSESEIVAIKSKLHSAKAARELNLRYVNWREVEKQLANYQEKLQALDSQTHSAEKHDKDCQQGLISAQKQAETIECLQKSQFDLQIIRQKLKEREQLELKQTQYKTECQELEAKREQFLKHKNQLQEEANRSESMVNKARLDVANLGELQSDIICSEKLIIDLEKLSSLKSELKISKQNADVFQTNLDIAKSEHDKHCYEANSLELQWHNGQAAILAQKLQSGHPCPVCGSLEHPLPATSQIELISREQVRAARDLEKQSLNRLRECESHLHRQLAELQEKEKTISEMPAELESYTSEQIEVLRAQLIDKCNQFELLKKIDINALQNNVIQLRERCIKGDEKIQEVVSALSKNSSTMTLLNQQIDELNKVIEEKGFASIAEVDKTDDSIVSQIQTLKENLSLSQRNAEAAHKALTEARSNHASTKEVIGETSKRLDGLKLAWQEALKNSQIRTEQAFLEQLSVLDKIDIWQERVEVYYQTRIKLEQSKADLTAQLSNTKYPNLEQLRLALEQTQLRYSEARKWLDLRQSIKHRLLKVISDIEKLHNENQRLDSEYQVYGTLYEVASGKTGSRISLHRFVLGVLLDDVLIQASQRMATMSKGRYQLVRKTEGFKGNAGRGLDLSVEDGYTGKSRDVATLSGGESFMAALSLALGLSDVVQSYSGGVRLDTLFIDEGFGSLDPESMDLALQTLIDLQQTGRMIGIISHVTELKQQMSLRIDVDASASGSRVRMVNAHFETQQSM